MGKAGRFTWLAVMAVVAVSAVVLTGCGGKGAKDKTASAEADTAGTFTDSRDGSEPESDAAPDSTVSAPDARPSFFTDSRDGKVYRKVTIGSQTWMAENLNFAAEGSKCYDNNPDNCAKYGRLYDWETALKACPEGWHLHSKDEYEALDDAVGGVEVAGEKLKAKSGWNNYKGTSGNGADDFGFSALPGGYGLSGSDSFHDVGTMGYWWSATEDSVYGAYGRYMYHNKSYVYRDGYIKSGMLSVRCVEDSNPN
jgi:uncharacterized protein (TIGR02145 family)